MELFADRSAISIQASYRPVHRPGILLLARMTLPKVIEYIESIYIYILVMLQL